MYSFELVVNVKDFVTMMPLLLLDDGDVEVIGSSLVDVSRGKTDKVYVDMSSVAGNWASAAAALIAQ